MRQSNFRGVRSTTLWTSNWARMCSVSLHTSAFPFITPSLLNLFTFLSPYSLPHTLLLSVRLLRQRGSSDVMSSCLTRCNGAYAMSFIHLAPPLPSPSLKCAVKQWRDSVTVCVVFCMCKNTLVLSLHNRCERSKVGQPERRRNIRVCVVFFGFCIPSFVCVCVKGQIDREMFQGERRWRNEGRQADSLDGKRR